MGRLIPEGAALADYQAYIADLEARRGWDAADGPQVCFRMVEEVGELFRAVREQKRASDAEATTRTIAHKLVDVLNFLFALANRYGIDLEASFLEKNGINEGRVWT